MKNKSKLFVITIFSLLSFPDTNVAQTPDLGMAANFTLFTVTGAMDNTGISTITGNIGTNTGDISGFGIVNGGIHTNDDITRQCSTDLLAAYSQLLSIAPTNTTHTPAFGGGETLVAGVYSIAAAGSIAGVINLDAQGDPDAVFIFKFGGAFTTGASSTVNLVNGALSCNVFWGADGAIAMAASTIMKGTLIANNGAISMGDGGTLEGRMLSTTGAVSVYGDYAYNGCGFVMLPVQLQYFTGTCEKGNAILKWRTASEAENNYFTVEHSPEGRNWQAVGTVKGSGTSSALHTYSLTTKLSNAKISYYRLKQTDFDDNFKYGDVIAVKNCEDRSSKNLSVYPNPSYGNFQLSFQGNRDQVRAIEIVDIRGQKIYQSTGFQEFFNISHTAPGIYFMNVLRNSDNIYLKVVIAK